MYPQVKARFKPRVGSVIDWSHVLSRGLLGAWIFNEGGGTTIYSLVNPNDKFTASSLGVSLDLPAWNVIGGYPVVGQSLNFNSLSSALDPAAKLTTPSAALTTSGPVSVFWAGQVLGDLGGASQNNPPLISMSYDNANSNPFYAYGILRKSNNIGNIGNKDLYFVDDSGGTIRANAVSGGIANYNQYLTATYTVASGSQIAYLNGIAATSANNSGSLSYGTGPQLNVNDFLTGSGSAQQDVFCIYIYGRVLSPYEIQWLHYHPLDLIKQSSKYIKYFVPGGGTPVNETLTDTFTFGDSIILGYGLIIGDTFTFSDSINATIPGTPLEISDSFLFQDTQQYEIDYGLLINEAVPFQDAINVRNDLFLSFNDTFTFTDAISQNSGIPVTATDTFSRSDAVATSTFGQINVTINDSFTFADSLIEFFTGLITVSINEDFFIFTDRVDKSSAFTFSFSDTLVLLDAVNEQTTSSNLITDTFTFSDSLAIGLSLILSDTFSFSDNVSAAVVTAVVDVPILVGDTFNLNDIVTTAIGVTFLPLSLSVSDSFNFADAVNFAEPEPFEVYLRRYLNDVIPN